MIIHFWGSTSPAVGSEESCIEYYVGSKTYGAAGCGWVGRSAGEMEKVGMEGMLQRANGTATVQYGAGVSDLLRAVWVRRRLICVLFSVLFLGGGFVVSLFPKVYQAKAILEVLPERQPNAAADPISDFVSDAVTVNTEARKVEAEPNVRSVFQEWEAGRLGPVMDNVGEFGKIAASVRIIIDSVLEKFCTPGALATRLYLQVCQISSAVDQEGARFVAFRRRLTVDAEHGTRLITVTFSATNPQVASAVANAIAAGYLARHSDRTENQSNRYINWLDERIATLGRLVAELDEAVANYRGSTGLIEMAKEVDSARCSPTVDVLAHTLESLAIANTALATARVKMNVLQQVRDDPSRAKSTSEVVGSRLLQDLTLQESVIEVKIASLTSNYAVDSPLTVKPRMELQAIRERIATEVAKLLDAAHREYASAEQMVDRINSEISQLYIKVTREEHERVHLRDLERHAGANSDLYTFYLRQERQAIEAASWHPIAASVVANAVPPVRPVFPDPRLLLPIGFVSSAAVSMMIGALIELRRQRHVFNGPLDFSWSTGLQVVGSVPWVRRPVTLDPPETFKAAIESVAFRLSGLTRHDSAQSMVVAVASAVPNEGKSVLSVSLARQFLADGARVLIIDADIRRPGIMAVVSGIADLPVSEVLCGPDGKQWDCAGKQGLHVVTLAGSGRSATVLLGALPIMVSNLKQFYDVVIVDTPPLLAVSDALAVLPCCDQICSLLGVAQAGMPSSLL